MMAIFRDPSKAARSPYAHALSSALAIVTLIFSVLTSAWSAPGFTTYTYDTAGRVVQTTNGSGSLGSLNYDDRANLLGGANQSLSGLSVNGLLPSAAPVGSEVTIEGNGFISGGTTVIFYNGIVAQIKKINTNEIIAVVPNGAASGPVTVSVTSSGTTQTASSSSSFTVTNRALPVITGFSPQVVVAAPSGQVQSSTTVTITGTGFAITPVNNTVTVGKTELLVKTASPTQLVVVIPSVSGSGKINVQTPNGSIQSSQDLFVIPYLPQLTNPPSLVNVTTGRITLSGAATSITTTSTASYVMLVVDAQQSQSINFVTSLGTYPSGASLSATIFGPTGRSVGVIGSVLNTGTYTFTPSLAMTGTHSILVKASAAGTVKVQALATQSATGTTLASSAPLASQGSGVTWTATVTGNNPNNGWVIFYASPTQVLGKALLVNGKAQLTSSSLALGTYQMYATYLGDASNSPSTSVTIQQAIQVGAKIVLSLTTSASTLVVGQPETYQVALTNATAPTGTVSFYDGGTLISRTPVKSAVCYQGSASNGNSPPSFGYDPASASCTVAGQSVFLNSTYYYATLTAAAGVVGSRTITATYSGDVSNQSATGSTAIIVNNKTVPVVSLAASAGIVVVGQPETYQVALTNATAPTGTVSFYDGGTLISSTPVKSAVCYQGSASNGNSPPSFGYDPASASCTVAGQSVFLNSTYYYATLTAAAGVVGSRTITATYSGDVSNQSATGSTAIIVNNKTVPVVSLAASAGIVVVGQPETYQVALTNATAPTGTVSFYDGGTLISSTPVKSAVCYQGSSSPSSYGFNPVTGSCTVAGQTVFQTGTYYYVTLTAAAGVVGNRAITATYSGDVSNQGASGTTAIIVTN